MVESEERWVELSGEAHKLFSLSPGNEFLLVRIFSLRGLDSSQIGEVNDRYRRLLERGIWEHGCRGRSLMNKRTFHRIWDVSDVVGEISSFLSPPRGFSSGYLTCLGAALSSEAVFELGLRKSGADAILGDDRIPALSWASKMGSHEFVGRLIARGANVNAVDVKGRTALHHSVLRCEARTIRLLVDAGVDLNAVDLNSVSALTYAVLGKRTEMVRVLLELGCRVEVGVDPLIPASEMDLEDCGRALLEYGAPVDRDSGRGWTPLHTCALYNSVNMASALLEHRAPIDQPAKESLTPLHVSVIERNYDMTRLLLTAGADVACVNVDGQSTLHLAAVAGAPTPILTLLLEHGADIEARDHANATPLLVAVSFARRTTAEALLQAGANPYATGFGGDSPHSIASHNPELADLFP